MSDLARLRRASDVLEPERVIGVLDEVLHTWRTPHSLWRERLRREHGIFSPDVIERGVVRGLETWTGEALARLRREEVSERCIVPELVAVWLAGSIPTAAFGAIVLPLLAGASVWVKPASADPVSPRLFADSIRAVDAEVAEAIELGHDPKLLERADAVVVHGSDETVAELRSAVPVHHPFVGYGHKLSVAAIGANVEAEQAAEALGLDAALWDGRGCLSPAFAFVEDRPAGRARAVATALADCLGRLERDLARGSLTPEENAGLHELRAGLAVREGVEMWRSEGSLAWTVFLSRFEGAPPIPGALRAIPVVPVDGPGGLRDWCAALAPHLSTVGQAGWGGRLEVIEAAALAGGGSRVCALGKMQLPPIDWRHDGMRPIRPLLRVLDVEAEEPA